MPGNRIAFGGVKRVNDNEFSALETLATAMQKNGAWHDTC